MKQAYKKIPTFKTKEHTADLVKVTDKTIEKLLIKALQKQFPDHVYIGEDGASGVCTGQELTDKPTWIIDPSMVSEVEFRQSEPFFKFI